MLLRRCCGLSARDGAAPALAFLVRGFALGLGLLAFTGLGLMLLALGLPLALGFATGRLFLLLARAAVGLLGLAFVVLALLVGGALGLLGGDQASLKHLIAQTHGCSLLGFGSAEGCGGASGCSVRPGRAH